MRNINASPSGFSSPVHAAIPPQMQKLRLFSRMGVWYFKTVEGQVFGPFRYQNEAQSLLNRHLAEDAERRRVL